jgi:hypothetical protein
MFAVSAVAALCTVSSIWTPLVSAVAVQSSHAQAPSAVVKVKNGTLIGTHNAAYDQDYFLGVPYAQPPVGHLRLRNPQSLNTTFKTKGVAQYHAGCVGYGVSLTVISGRVHR